MSQAEGPATAIVTGAGGFIGARVVERLLSRGWDVYALGRARGGVHWPARMRASLDDIAGSPVDPALRARLHCTDASLGDASSVRAALTPPPRAFRTVLFHLAGDTRFNSEPTAAQRAVNVEAGPSVIAALGDGVGRVIHVSTAYVAGARDGWVRESEFDVGQSFRNGYESTKLAGELRMREVCAERGLPLVIVRPSIVINDTRTGRSSAFTHLNAMVEIVRRLQAHFRLGFGEVVSDRIRVPIHPDRHPNLIPVEVVVEALLQIADAPEAPGRAYHLCHPRPPAVRDFVSLLLEALAIAPKLRIDYTSDLEEPLTYTERMVMRSFKPYIAYLNAGSTFELTNTRRLLPGYDAMFPALDLAYLEKVVALHRAAGWSEPAADAAP